MPINIYLSEWNYILENAGGYRIDIWFKFIVIYIFLAVVTFTPSLKAILGLTKLQPGGASFSESPHFSEEEKKRLNQHYTRITGTLTFWKNETYKYGKFFNYCLCWVTVSSLLVPIIAQFTDSSPNAKTLLTIVSLYIAILLGVSRVFKVENHYKAYRNGESEFYDLYRRLLDRPEYFGRDGESQLEKYFIEAERLRKMVRNQETDSIPTLNGLEEKK
jgi:hypothetical protein